MTVDELQQLYRDIVLEHYRAPRGRTPLVHPNGRGLAVNAICGDQVEIEVELVEDVLRDVSARAVGCSIAVAAGSVLTELVRARPASAAPALAAALEAIVHGEEPPSQLDPRLRAFAPVAQLPSRQRCAMLAWEALADAIADARRREA